MRSAVASALFCCACSGLALAQPAMSRGEQILAISYSDCMARARGAFQGLGWVNIGSGGAYTNAFRGGSGAYITCNEAVPGRMIVNIIVATHGGDAGTERQQLQGAMADPTGVPRPDPRPSGCGWVDAQDGRFPADPGRGVRSLEAHRNHVLNAGPGSTPGAVAGRFDALRSCLPREAYSRLYADASVLVAAYGRRLGWPDGQDGRVPADPGRGVSSWQAHHDYATATGASSAGGLFRERLIAIYSAVPRDVAAQLYGELSVLIARYGVGQN